MRCMVVPKAYRYTVFVALHTSPLAGYSSYIKTYWRIATRFSWPIVVVKVREWMLVCVMYRATNATSHKVQQVMKVFELQEPFEVIHLNIWSPGTIERLIKGKVCVLTIMDDMKSYVGAKTIANKSAETMAHKVFTSFFCVYVMAQMVIIDEGPENQD